VAGVATLAAVATWLVVAMSAAGEPARQQRIRVSSDGKHFMLHPNGKPFVPWGFNYDHDERDRLIEEYWADEWTKVEEDFAEMKELGANVVRIHLQLGKFMDAPDQPNAAAIDRLTKLVHVAERLGLYLDLTGLACYLKEFVPGWYDALDEPQRWAVQARFWEAIAESCAASPAIFCYDLMNEPVVSGGPRKPGEWLGPPFAGRFHFVQFVSLDPRDRPRPAVAREWIKTLSAAVRTHDRDHLITVGLVPWSLDRPGLTSGFVPREIAGELDFVSVHLYPEKDKVDAELQTLRGFAVGKPVVIEEMFPLRCSMEEFDRFVESSRETAAGWIGFYWGKTEAEYRRSGTIGDAIMAQWLEYFRKNKTP
jgi:hypothetical protein